MAWDQKAIDHLQAIDSETSSPPRAENPTLRLKFGEKRVRDENNPRTPTLTGRVSTTLPLLMGCSDLKSAHSCEHKGGATSLHIHLEKSPT